MGLLRTLYALTVVLYHSWPTAFVFVGGENAVQCFYIISGFLISYILVERKSYRSVGAFYVNRYLRLYPIYVVVAVPTLILILVTGHFGFIEVYKQAPASAVAFLAVSNAILFGQDWLLFMGVHSHHVEFVKNFANSDVLLYHGQIIHPAWTLGIELSFYLIAPFLLPRRKLVYAVLAASLGLRLLFIHWGFGTRDPWTYRFFPTELALFLLGALAHQVLLPKYERLDDTRRRWVSNVGTGFIVCLSLGYAVIPVPDIYKKLFLLCAFTGCVPLTFLFQRRFRFDGWIGDLSYPIYIGHILVLWSMSFLLKRSGILDQRIIALVCVAVTILFAMSLNHWVALPFERLRNRFRTRVRR